MRTTDQISATLLKMHSTNPLTLSKNQKCKHANTFSGFRTYSHAWKMINNIWIVYLKEETQVKNDGLWGNTGGLFLSREQWLLSSHHRFHNNIIASLQREVMFVWFLCVNWPFFAGDISTCGKRLVRHAALTAAQFHQVSKQSMLRIKDIHTRIIINQ